MTPCGESTFSFFRAAVPDGPESIRAGQALDVPVSQGERVERGAVMPGELFGRDRVVKAHFNYAIAVSDYRRITVQGLEQ
ncbi:hypothetical protein [uncultured Alistipes sp.]|uniref:hypothetical protein n=1 Tax=uncultured Alistipes sp. TaxID=538949 RepID=UPI00320B76A6